MWHDLARDLLTGAGTGADPQVPSSTTPGEVVVGVLGAVSGLLVAAAALMTALAKITRRRNALPPDPAPSPHPRPAGGHYSSELEARNAALENFLIRLHFNPNRIVTGEENFADAHFD